MTALYLIPLVSSIIVFYIILAFHIPFLLDFSGRNIDFMFLIILFSFTVLNLVIWKITLSDYLSVIIAHVKSFRNTSTSFWYLRRALSHFLFNLLSMFGILFVILVPYYLLGGSALSLIFGVVLAMIVMPIAFILNELYNVGRKYFEMVGGYPNGREALLMHNSSYTTSELLQSLGEEERYQLIKS